MRVRDPTRILWSSLIFQCAGGCISQWWHVSGIALCVLCENLTSIVLVNFAICFPGCKGAPQASCENARDHNDHFIDMHLNQQQPESGPEGCATHPWQGKTRVYCAYTVERTAKSSVPDGGRLTRAITCYNLLTVLLYCALEMKANLPQSDPCTLYCTGTAGATRTKR